MNDASNVSILLVLGTALIVGAVAGALRAAYLLDQLVGDALDDSPTGAADCTCGDSWCDYVPNKAQRAWWRP